jgi:CheY-like chemotaxis protein
MKPQKKVYCVEDNRQVATLLQKQLETLGYLVCGIADNAPDAVAGIGKSNPDIALIDIELHGKFEGLDIGDYLVSKTDIPFIYLTGHDEQKILEKARMTIPDGFLLKPFDQRQLHAAIEMAQRIV